MNKPSKLITGALAAAALLAGIGIFLALERSPRIDPGEARGDIQVISKGRPLNLRTHLAAGKYTLFDYYADWCPPCRELSPRLEELARQHDNLALRKIDIVSWSHPVAQQQGVTDLPFLRLYGPDGTLVAEGDAAIGELHRLFGFELPTQPM
jgi:thiol-disulfide isomerase/thioredoxin